MVASKIMLKMSPDTPLKAAKPALNIGDVVSFQPAKEAQFPQRTILIVKAVDLKTATVTFTPTLWNRLNLNSPGVIKLRMIQNDKDAPTQIKFTNIEKMLFTATVPVMPKTEAGELTVTTKNQIEVEEISISLSKEQLDTIEPGASTITPTENKPFTLAAQSFIDDTTYQSFCGKIEGEASMVGTKEVTLQPRTMTYKKRGDTFSIWLRGLNEGGVFLCFAVAKAALESMMASFGSTPKSTVTDSSKKLADASSSGSSAAGKKKGAEAEIARRKLLPNVPEDARNPFPPKSKNLETDMPQVFPMYGDKTYDVLSKKTASSMKYEYVVLAPALSYMHDYLAYVTETVDGLAKVHYSADEAIERLKRVENSIHGVFSLLCNRYTVLQLRAAIDGDGASKADSDSLRAKLKFVEDCVYQGAEDLVTDTLLKEYIDEFDRGKNKASLYANMKNAALAETGFGRGAGRGGGKGGWRDEKKEQNPAGGKGKTDYWG
ncbi:hypothetical protein CYMTET_5204 [Cymbomonas tetramitiformis]|uniref:Uncharacterized protein n=1 Tax=Cymbomonas tetramitiformis TaxID=36881 RepID=A0AAE0GZK3_9CHLO|nr:hypothetical protein CYMTET_5204 [Cymbomonas tetramitiformis]